MRQAEESMSQRIEYVRTCASFACRAASLPSDSRVKDAAMRIEATIPDTTGEQIAQLRLFNADHIKVAWGRLQTERWVPPS